MVANFKLTKKEITLWTDHWVPPSPHQEYIPYMNLFRPLAKTQWHLMSEIDDEYCV